MLVYIEYGNGTKVKNVSTIKTDACYAPVFFDEPVDFEKLEGYVTYIGPDGQTHASFDPQTWADHQAELAEAEARKAAQQMLDELSFKTVLESATDEQALVMKPLYAEWNGAGMAYVKGQYLQSEGDLFKVLQNHTSQADWTPKTTPSLFAKVLTDPQGEEVLEWVQPDSTNAYMKGDKAKQNGKIYVSKIDNNVWPPADYPAGWEEVKEETEEEQS